MDIGFVYYPFGKDAGSFGVHGHHLAEGLVRRGHRLLMLGRRDGEGIVGFPQTKWGKVQLGWNADLLYIRVGFLDWRYKLTLLKCMRPRIPVVWEINAPSEELLAFGNEPSRWKRINADLRRKRALGHLVDAAVCVSQPMMDYTVNHLGIRRAIAVPNGGDPRAFRVLTADRTVLAQFPDKFKVVWAGNTDMPWQDLDTVLAVAESLERDFPHILFLIICGGARMRPMAARPNVLPLAAMTPEDVRRHLIGADCILVTYKSYDWCPVGFYNSPLKMFEAMAAARPMIVSSCGGQIDEVLEDGADSLLVPPGDADALRRAVLTLAGDSDLRRRLGEAALAKLEARYTWDHTADAVDRLLVSLAGSRRCRRGAWGGVA